MPWKNVASGGQRDYTMVTRARYPSTLFLVVLLAGQSVLAEGGGWQVSLPASTSTSLQLQTATPLDGGVMRVAQNGPWGFTLVEDPDIFDDGFED